MCASSSGFEKRDMTKPASSSQQFAIRCKTGFDVRGCKINQTDCNNVLDRKVSQAAAIGIVTKWKGAEHAQDVSPDKLIPRPSLALIKEFASAMRSEGEGADEYELGDGYVVRATRFGYHFYLLNGK